MTSYARPLRALSPAAEAHRRVKPLAASLDLLRRGQPWNRPEFQMDFAELVAATSRQRVEFLAGGSASLPRLRNLRFQPARLLQGPSPAVAANHQIHLQLPHSVSLPTAMLSRWQHRQTLQPLWVSSSAAIPRTHAQLPSSPSLQEAAWPHAEGLGGSEASIPPEHALAPAERTSATQLRSWPESCMKTHSDWKQGRRCLSRRKRAALHHDSPLLV
mmetsp:Transcript_70137/g.131123  ORF Transcript_70137/g.131123 Transcript_70137/m.131123 type:complete len:216 (-) Transcript_70137:346-993(-)